MKRITTPIINKDGMITSERGNKKVRKNKFDKHRENFKVLAQIRLAELQLMDRDTLLVKKTKKQRASQNTKHPEKRSRYIGVSKNGTNWQSLVVVGNEKIYIATTPSEKKAAEIVDFYTLLHRLKQGKLNSDYTVNQAINLICLMMQEIDMHGNRHTPI